MNGHIVFFFFFAGIHALNPAKKEFAGPPFLSNGGSSTGDNSRGSSPASDANDDRREGDEQDDVAFDDVKTTPASQTTGTTTTLPTPKPKATSTTLFPGFTPEAEEDMRKRTHSVNVPEPSSSSSSSAGSPAVGSPAGANSWWNVFFGSEYIDTVYNL
jgi:hypothetical protein